jgi:uncharacterized membrane protein
MTDQPTSQDPVSEGAATSADEQAAPEVVVELVSDGAHTLIVAQFPTMDAAQSAYEALKEIERGSSLRIDGVVVASCDAEGKVHLGTVTDHSTKTGLKWGVVGGALLGVIFPPSILAGAAGAGVLGATLGKVRNVFHRRGIADELAGVMQPNTSGVVALVEDTAVVAIREALAQADRIVTKAIDKEIAAEIDREAAAAKASLTEG